MHVPCDLLNNVDSAPSQLALDIFYYCCLPLHSVCTRLDVVGLSFKVLMGYIKARSICHKEFSVLFWLHGCNVTSSTLFTGLDATIDCVIWLGFQKLYHILFLSQYSTTVLLKWLVFGCDRSPVRSVVRAPIL